MCIQICLDEGGLWLIIQRHRGSVCSDCKQFFVSIPFMFRVRQEILAYCIFGPLFSAQKKKKKKMFRMYEVYYVRLYCITIIRYNTQPRLATLGAVLINTLLRFDALILNWSKKTSDCFLSLIFSLLWLHFFFCFFLSPHNPLAACRLGFSLHSLLLPSLSHQKCRSKI